MVIFHCIPNEVKEVESESDVDDHVENKESFSYSEAAICKKEKRSALSTLY